MLIILSIFPFTSIANNGLNSDIEAEIIGSIKLLGLPGLGGYIVNMGTEPVYNLSAELKVSGGFNDNIDLIFKRELKDVLPGKVDNTVHSVTFSIIWGVFGFGSIQLDMNVSSSNTDTIIVHSNGFQIGYYTFILG